LGLAMPNQYSQTVRKQISSWFWGDNFGPKSPNLIVLLYYMIPCSAGMYLKVTKFNSIY